MLGCYHVLWQVSKMCIRYFFSDQKMKEKSSIKDRFDSWSKRNAKKIISLVINLNSRIFCETGKLISSHHHCLPQKHQISLNLPPDCHPFYKRLNVTWRKKLFVKSSTCRCFWRGILIIWQIPLRYGVNPSRCLDNLQVLSRWRVCFCDSITTIWKIFLRCRVNVSRYLNSLPNFVEITSYL